MAKISYLLGDWIDPNNKIYTVRKAEDRSNTYLNIELNTDTEYNYPFTFYSNFITGNYWHRFDSASFENLIVEYQLKKVII